jgi:hypothetical protein
MSDEKQHVGRSSRASEARESLILAALLAGKGVNDIAAEVRVCPQMVQPGRPLLYCERLLMTVAGLERVITAGRGMTVGGAQAGANS